MESVFKKVLAVVIVISLYEMKSSGAECRSQLAQKKYILYLIPIFHIHVCGCRSPWVQMVSSIRIIS